LKTTLILAAALLLVIPGTSLADPPNPPPAYGGYLPGWGMNPHNWNWHTGSWTSPLGLYDPTCPHGGGGSWVVGYDGNAPLYIDYRDVTLELWIEMSMIQFYENTSYKWHRLGRGGETIQFIIQGWTKSNEGCWVSLVGDPDYDINALKFISNIGVGQDPNVRDTLSITWEGWWGNGLSYGNEPQMSWTTLTSSLNDIDLAELNPGECWYQFRGTFTLKDYEADGYYKLVMDGCPSPEL